MNRDEPWEGTETKEGQRTWRPFCSLRPSVPRTGTVGLIAEVPRGRLTGSALGSDGRAPRNLPKSGNRPQPTRSGLLERIWACRLVLRLPDESDAHQKGQCRASGG